jgi:hypothetical protein
MHARMTNPAYLAPDAGHAVQGPSCRQCRH